MLDAVIRDGKLFCSKCDNLLGGTKDCSLVSVNGKTYIQFIRECSNIQCGEQSHYETLHTIDERKVFIFPQEDIKKIKEENKKVSDE